MQVITVAPGLSEDTVRDAAGSIVHPPGDWQFLPAGDAACTRRVKAAGEFWIVEEKKGRKIFTRGIWAPKTTIARVKTDLDRERSTEFYARRKLARLDRSQSEHAAYVIEFQQAVVTFLAFHSSYAGLAEQLAETIATRSTPIGSGTVARTKRISIAERAEAAVFAWLRHETTSYEEMKIPRVKGARRAVRKMVVQNSKQLLERYRHGQYHHDEVGPIEKALTNKFLNAKR